MKELSLHFSYVSRGLPVDISGQSWDVLTFQFIPHPSYFLFLSLGNLNDPSSMYTSPHIRDGQQADTYALGIILCELVTCFSTQTDRSKVCSYA